MIQAYFLKRQAQCPRVYFSMDLNDESHLRNIVWADYRCRQSYKEFGDVVTFDTTYLTNKYDMPLAPFIDINHQGRSTLLGCGLVSTKTRILLCDCSGHNFSTNMVKIHMESLQIKIGSCKMRFKLFFQIQNIDVLVLNKMPEKFGYHVDKNSIFGAIHGLVYDSQSTREFKDGWTVMIDAYDLNENDWLSKLYENRGHRFSMFLKTTF